MMTVPNFPKTSYLEGVADREGIRGSGGCPERSKDDGRNAPGRDKTRNRGLHRVEKRPASVNVQFMNRYCKNSETISRISGGRKIRY